jgi:CelD/BcsL family acetyltransferase involved in cellulose biosynthesis
VSVRIVDLDSDTWRDFAASREEFSIFHTYAWASTLQETYGFRPFGIVLEDAGSPVAGMPVVEISRVGRRRWVSLPFSDACAVLGDDRDAVALLHAADAMRPRRRVAQIEIRASPKGSAWPLLPAGVLHRLRLESSEDAMLGRLRGSQVARNIARSRREGVDVTFDRGPEGVAVFYDLHLQTRRRQGVPIQPRRFFDALWRSMIDPGHGFVAIARTGDRPIGAAVVLDHRETLMYKFGASDEQALGRRPNHAVLWSVIQWGICHRRKMFDLGRSDVDNTGLRAFKSSWGAEEIPLFYTFVGNHTSRRRHSSRLLRPIIRHSPPAVCRAIGEALYRYSA